MAAALRGRQVRPVSRATRIALAAAALALAAASACLLTGCANARYYAQAIRGHLALMHASRPVQDWLDDAATPADLKTRLALAQRIRAFAVAELALPDNASYRRYSHLGRRAAVWNVAAAAPDALTLRQWCFAVAGCVGYRGYYDEGSARALAAQLQADEGLEVTVYGVPAYSTLGWMNWAGGDPLLSTFIHYPEGELARMVFHELAHQVAYVGDDTMFNESYATAVERLGVARWLAQADEAARREYAALHARRQAFGALSRHTRDALGALYAQHQAGALDGHALATRKAQAMARFRQDYAQLKADWAKAGTPFNGYDAWVNQANNAFFAIQAAYDELVPGFEALFAQGGGDWPRFHAAVRELARQPREQRRQRLRALAGGVAP
ncbi:MAG: aminopeptidase [Pseudomonadota bacterium]|nr:aminopeptidase [Pseudomonadota bacterium]